MADSKQEKLNKRLLGLTEKQQAQIDSLISKQQNKFQESSIAPSDVGTSTSDEGASASDVGSIISDVGSSSSDVGSCGTSHVTAARTSNAAVDLKKIGNLDRASYDTTADLVHDFRALQQRL